MILIIMDNTYSSSFLELEVEGENLEKMLLLNSLWMNWLLPEVWISTPLLAPSSRGRLGILYILYKLDIKKFVKLVSNGLDYHQSVLF